MNQDPASLSNLHDIVLPPEVSWWPLSPGWWVLMVIAVIALLVLVWRAWSRWKANAYRREALRELDRLEDSASVAILLRRTALAVTPRPEVAVLSGEAWLDWLASRTGVNMPDSVREHLGYGLYSPQESARVDEDTREYAAQWIRTHRIA